MRQKAVRINEDLAPFLKTQSQPESQPVDGMEDSNFREVCNGEPQRCARLLTESCDTHHGMVY
jgi:hypothetical protein